MVNRGDLEVPLRVCSARALGPPRHMAVSESLFRAKQVLS